MNYIRNDYEQKIKKLENTIRKMNAYTVTGMESGEWSYRTENDDNYRTSGIFQLRLLNNVILGSRTKQTQDGKPIPTESSTVVEGYYIDGKLKMYIVGRTDVVQFYELKQTDQNEFEGRYWNIGVNNDKGTIIIQKDKSR